MSYTQLQLLTDRDVVWRRVRKHLCGLPSWDGLDDCEGLIVKTFIWDGYRRETITHNTSDVFELNDPVRYFE